MATLDYEDIQGNILRGYKRYPAVAHVFGRLAARDVPSWKAFLTEMSDQLTLAAWAAPPVTTFNVGLSQRAVARLQPDVANEISDVFPAFSAGMTSRAESLGDGPEFESALWAERDVWISIHGQELDAVDRAVQHLKARTENLNLREAAPYGRALVKDGGWYEHFGFRDDISFPAIDGTPGLTAQDWKGRGKLDPHTKEWSPVAAGEFLLGHSNESGMNALDGLTQKAREVLMNGTFAVVRNLEQDVVTFRRYLRAQAGAAGADNLAASMMGRKQNGVPLAKPNARLEPSLVDVSDFSYVDDEKGARCPVGAHVRRVNPRTSGRHRLVRRGITYGPELPAGQEDNAERGLWFVAFNASLEDQFEFIQKQWINSSIGRSGVGSEGETRDPIVSRASRAFVINGDQSVARPPVLLLDMPSFITCRGGQYYFTPGRNGLLALAR